MSVTITQVSVHGADGAPSAGEDLTAYAEVTNGGGETARIGLNFTLDAQSVGTQQAELMPGASQWVQAHIGQLASGGHDLNVVGAVDDGRSSSQAEGGTTFEVAAPATPHVTIGQPQIRPHSNVEHHAGTAWTDERIGVWVEITNSGSTHLTATVWVSEDGGQSGQHQLTLGPSESQWVQQDFEPMAAGQHTVTASASTETANQSVVLGHSQAVVTISAPTSNFHRCNVQLTVHDFRGKPMVGRSVFVQFLGMDNSVADGAETVQGSTASSGVLTQANVMVPDRGSMHVMAVSNGQPDEPVEGTVRYHLAAGQTDIGYTVVQDHSDQKVKARSLQGVKNKLTAEGHAGLEIEVLSIGGSVGSEDETSREFETEVEWEVRVGRPSFAFTADAN